MDDWNAALYLKFERERTRPAIDLLAAVPLDQPRRIVDLGCGPGNSTRLLVDRFPHADILGVDTSPDMLAKAREAVPQAAFAQADVAGWEPPAPVDLIFANAVLQWVPGHAALLPRLMRCLAPGGALAVQMPDNLDEPSHALMRAIAGEPPFVASLAQASAARTTLGAFEDFYGWLKPHAADVDLWRTTYVHQLDGAAAIVEWVRATGLRPFLDPLAAAECTEFVASYEAAIAAAYPPQADGKSLLRFPRLFFVAVKN